MRVEVLEPFKMLEWYTIDLKTTVANFESAKYRTHLNHPLRSQPLTLSCVCVCVAMQAVRDSGLRRLLRTGRLGAPSAATALT